MEKIALAVEKRDDVGKCPNRRLRATGRIPAIMYGGKEQVMLSVDRQDFERKFKRISENVLIDLSIKGGDTREVLIKDYQKDKVRGTLIHLDFYEVIKGHKLRAKIPLRLEGTPVGVRVDKGMLDISLYHMEVECEPKDLPEAIIVDVTGIAVNHSLHIRDIVLPAGVVTHESPDTVVATVLSTARIEAASAAEAAADAAAAAAAAPKADAGKAAAPKAQDKAAAKK